MNTKGHIEFRHLPNDERMRNFVIRLMNQLEQEYDHLESYKVVIAKPHQHRYKGHSFDLYLAVKISGTVYEVRREPSADGGCRDLLRLIKRAFAELNYKLEKSFSHLPHQKASGGDIWPVRGGQQEPAIVSTDHGEQGL